MTRPSPWQLALLARVWRARSALALVHGVKTLLGAAFALPTTWALAGAGRGPAVAADLAQWISVMRLGAELPELAPRYGLVPLAAAILLAPWLQLVWLRALDQPAVAGGPDGQRDDPGQSSLPEQLRWGLSRYRTGVAIWLLTGAHLALILAAAAGAALGLPALSAGLHDQRTADLCAVAALSPFALAAVHALCVRDACVAAAVRGERSLRRLLAAARAQVGWALVLSRVAWLATPVLVIALAELVSRVLMPAGAASTASALVLGQLAALLATAARGAWLATLLSRGRATTSSP